MSLQPALQPIVCCLGNPVAGNPTQFVMSRAAKDCGLDWRFFTSQVTEEAFEAAVRGVQALGMQGMVVLDPFQTKIIPWLDTVTQPALRLNRVSIARSDGNSWLGDNLFPVAVWQALQAAAEQDAAPHATLDVASHDSPLETPAIREGFNTLFVGSDALHESLELCRPDDNTCLERWISGTSSSTEERLSELSQKEWHAIVFEKPLDSATIRGLLNLRWSPAPLFGCLESSLAQEGRKARELFFNRGFRAIEPVEWMVRETIANFAFWTGVAPPADGIRESLEEYLQW